MCRCILVRSVYAAFASYAYGPYGYIRRCGMTHTSRNVNMSVLSLYMRN